MTTSTKYGRMGGHLAAGDVDYAADTIGVVLLDNTHVPNMDSHEFLADIIADELPTGNGYTAGGQALATKTATYDAAGNDTVHNAASSVWTPSAGQTLGPARYAAVFKDTGVDATSVLLVLVDFEANTSAVGAPLTIDWSDTGGVFRV